MEEKSKDSLESSPKTLSQSKSYPPREPLRKVQIIAPIYYARKDIQAAIYDFCKSREVVGNFNNKFFGKRPDCLDYPSDIINSAKQGVTSFHASEELWANPLDINVDMNKERYNALRIGWDFLIDIDAKYLDYAKVAAIELLRELEVHGVKNYGIKYSGSKGFHIIVPFKAFPKALGEDLAKDNFPEWPRMIANYLKYRTEAKINQKVFDLEGREKLTIKGDLVLKHSCPRCGGLTERRKIGKYVCRDKKCKGEQENMKSNRKEMVCSNCYGKMDRVSQREIDFCPKCNINTAKLEASVSSYGGKKDSIIEKFTEEKTLKSTEDSVDLVLVSPRHLFRAPYSLHEKTSLASIVITKEDIENFKPTDADPLKIKSPKVFMPNCVEGEAKELLLQAIDWGKKNEEKVKKYEGQSVIDISGLSFTEDMFPPIIKKILLGIKGDGRKRALSLLLSFYSSLNFPVDYMEEKILEWNKRNEQALKEGYIISQISWYAKNKRLPPNYDKPVYKLFGALSPEESSIKNPINYSIKLAMKSSSNPSLRNKEKK